MADGADILSDELGGRLPDGVQGLSDKQLRELADLLRGAKKRQAQELDEGMEESLEIVPRLMRGPVRKMLYG